MTGRNEWDRREFVSVVGMGALGGALVANPGSAKRPRAEGPRIQRLSWAGVLIESGTTTLLIDPIVTDIWDGHAGFAIHPIEIRTGRRYVLLTHLHNDHYDLDAVEQAVGERGRVVCGAVAANEVASDGFRSRPIETFEPLALGDMTVTAVPAVDGVGVAGGQVSWIVRAAGRTVFHGGDTLWHGQWGLLGRQYGPFDVAFLPINGFRLLGQGASSAIASSLTPDQAVAAGMLLRASTVSPIHYGVDHPGYYAEVPEAESLFLEHARRHGLETDVLQPGDELAWSAETR